MARTAPVPNMPIIPGMNPGIFVMGGGGAGGGKGGKGGGGAGGGQGADGEGGGDGADGGGNGAGSCGTGGTGSCTNCSDQISRGDPVDVTSGEVFTLPSVDFSLPGYFHFDMHRFYSTAQLERDVGMGPGWGHSLAWEIEVGRGRTIVRDGTGREETFAALPEPGMSASKGPWGLMRMKEGFVLRPGNEFLHLFTPDKPGDRLLRLRYVTYRNRGGIRIDYRRGVLSQATDTVGRVIRFGHDGRGRIVSASCSAADGSTLTFARYAYSPAGDLSEYIDGDGNLTRFDYDAGHRLVKQRFATGLTFHYVYDDSGRCIETWGAYDDGKDPALHPDLPALLADQRTPAKGIYHVRMDFIDADYSEAIDSVRVQRFESDEHGRIKLAVDGEGYASSRTYDHRGAIATHTNKSGNTTFYQRDNLGLVIGETDPEGRTVTLVRDGEGRVLELTDPAGGAVVVQRDDNGDPVLIQNQRGGITRIHYGDKGLVREVVDARGQTTRYQHDSHGNVIVVDGPDGQKRYEYDFWGRRLREYLPGGRTFAFGHSAGGKLVSITDPMGRTRHTQYDALGDIVAITTPDGATTRFEYGGYRFLTATIHPSGETQRRFYNREGWEVERLDPRGNRWTFEHDSNGQVIKETRFGGDVVEHGYDPMSLPIWAKTPLGRVEVERNAVGQIVKRSAADGSVTELDYDSRGDLIAARYKAVTQATQQGDVEVLWERDPTGDIVRETFRVHGHDYEVESSLDPHGNRLRLRSSLGHALQFQRDEAARVAAIREETGGSIVELARTQSGQVEQRVLPAGGRIIDHHDAADRVERRQVVSSGSPAAGGQPAWLGGAGSIDKTFHYNAVDDLLRVHRVDEDTVEYTYDLRRRLTDKRVGNTIAERFTADGASNPYELPPEGPPRAYDAANRVTERGEVKYHYDDGGRLVEKIVPQKDGDEIWRYSWDGFGRLAFVERPGGDRICFAYDAFARRVAKWREIPLPDGSWDVEDPTHFVWDRATLIHEHRPSAGSDALRTFLYEEPNDVVPLAHCDASRDWRYYVGDISETPEDVIDGSGQVLGRLRRRAFGRTESEGESTPLRFPGQYEDDETGLHYNRYRYYDPDTGRYLSPDPIGLAGGENLYRYGINPIGWYDPMGLEHEMEVLSATDGNGNPIAGVEAGQVFHSGMGDDCPSDLSSRTRCHTERKLNAALRASGQPLAGAQVSVRGEYPPCPNCHRAMQEFASNNDMDHLDYEWVDENGDTQRIRYGGSQPEALEGDNADRLVGAYGMQDSDRSYLAGSEGRGDSDGGYTFHDEDGNSTWRGAWGEYGSQRDAIRDQ